MTATVLPRPSAAGIAYGYFKRPLKRLTKDWSTRENLSATDLSRLSVIATVTPTEKLLAGQLAAQLIEQRRRTWISKPLLKLRNKSDDRLARTKPAEADLGVPKQIVYRIDEGDIASRCASVRGGKGAGLAELVSMGLPVPAGATITTHLCRHLSWHHYLPAGLAEQLAASLAGIESDTRTNLGRKRKPLLLSVRSGASVSMPGMLDTVLNVGLNQVTLRGLAKRFGERFAWDCYRRFLAMFGATVLGVNKLHFQAQLTRQMQYEDLKDEGAFSVDQLKLLCGNFKRIIEHCAGRAVPDDPIEQLALAIFAVVRSWNSQRAKTYRKAESIDDNIGTAVNIQAMVFGNAGTTSGTGVVFSRNPSTGAKGLFGEYLSNAQGEDVVSGIRTPELISALASSQPVVYEEMVKHVKTLELHFQDIVDVEFTVEAGKLYLLQCRAAKRTAEASANFAVDQVIDGFWSKARALTALNYIERKTLTCVAFDPSEMQNAVINPARFLFRGLSASPGAVSGRLVLSTEKAQELAAHGLSLVLVRPDTSPDDLPGMLVAAALVTAAGGSTCHAAVVARARGIPAVVGCKFTIDGARVICPEGDVIEQGEVISVDGKSGFVMRGVLPTVESLISENVEIYKRWWAAYAHTDVAKPLDVHELSLRVNLNQWLNDFYLTDLMQRLAIDTTLEDKCYQLSRTVQSRLASVFTTYLALAVTSELTYYTDVQCPADPPISAWSELGANLGFRKGMTHTDYSRVVKMLSERPMHETVDFFDCAVRIFTEPGWSPMYGGKKWVAIARTARDYLGGVLPQAVFIDHVFDLRHNGGRMFNKHSMVAEYVCETTLVDQLDVKKKATSLSSLYGLLKVRASVGMEVQNLLDQGVKLALWELYEPSFEIMEYSHV